MKRICIRSIAVGACLLIFAVMNSLGITGSLPLFEMTTANMTDLIASERLSEGEFLHPDRNPVRTASEISPSGSKLQQASNSDPWQESLSLRKMMELAMQPVGSTLYVWGGGWNEEDTGAGIEAVSLGVSENWKAFFDEETAAYDYLNYPYYIHDGLDCSGYIGWLVYNTVETESGHEGYVTNAKDMAADFASRGWGTWKPAEEVTEFLPGDIMSTGNAGNGAHVYMVLGQFEDGSVLLVHAAPPGVRISGTPDASGNSSSLAVSKAAELMETYFPEFQARYPDVSVPSDFLHQYEQFRWSPDFMPDAAEIQSMSPEQVLEICFPSDAESAFSSEK